MSTYALFMIKSIDSTVTGYQQGHARIPQFNDLPACSVIGHSVNSMTIVTHARLRQLSVQHMSRVELIETV